MSLPLTLDLADWPGTVLRVARSGEVLGSNGRLESLLGTGVVGRMIPDLLDHDSSLAIWTRLSALPARMMQTQRIEFSAEGRVVRAGAFSVLSGTADDHLWLVEQHPGGEARPEGDLAPDGDLGHAQNDLIIERGRLDEFAHVVSHDLKAPLRAIRDYTELLLEPTIGSNSAEREEYLGRIADLTMRMRGMIDAALEYARAGRASNRTEVVDTGALLRDVIAFLAPPPQVRIEVGTELPTLETERVPWEQVFRNLPSNAIAYRRASDAHITVSARDAGDAWEFVVADNGPGIHEADRERIWRVFYTSRPGEGTGLGLALVRRIVEGQRGTVTMRSEAGRGTAFHVRWPKRPSATAPQGGSDDAR